MTETLGNLGDFIGGFGVIITVIYLAYQIKKNTASTRSATYQSVVADVTKWTTQVGLSNEATRIYSTGIEGLDKLSKTEQLRFTFILASVVRSFENIHYQFISGAIPKNLWDGWSSRILGVFANPGAAAWWDSQKSAYSTEFQTFIDEPPSGTCKTSQFASGSQVDSA